MVIRVDTVVEHTVRENLVEIKRKKYNEVYKWFGSLLSSSRIITPPLETSDTSLNVIGTWKFIFIRGDLLPK